MVLVFVLDLIRGRIVGRRLGQLHLRHVFVCTFLVSNALVELGALIFLNFLLTRHCILIVGRWLLLCTGLGFQGLWIGRQLLRASLGRARNVRLVVTSICRLLLICVWVAEGVATLLRSTDIHAYFLRHLIYLWTFCISCSIERFFAFSARLSASLRRDFGVSGNSCGIIERNAVDIDRYILGKVIARHYHLQVAVGLLEACASPRLLPDQILTSSTIDVVTLSFQCRRSTGPILANFRARGRLVHFAR